ncbi:MAG: 6-bladed beta-propeller, partial [Thioalkalivibrio sp.]|nr:6-bladed beta-propeller [Thioalkalivibrio sp.]
MLAVARPVADILFARMRPSLIRRLLIGPLTVAVACGTEPTMSVPIWFVSSAHGLDIGGAGADDGVTLFQVVAVERTKRGETIVGNRGSESILVFDSVGALRDEIGRRGRGPGEFEQLQGVDLCEDDR